MGNVKKQNNDSLFVTTNGKFVNLNKNVDRLPFINVEIYFDQDMWNFGDAKYRFDDINNQYKKYVKDAILTYRLNQYRSSSIKKYLIIYKTIIKFFVDRKVYAPETISIKDIKSFNEFLSTYCKSEGYKTHCRRLLSDLLTKIENYNNIDYSLQKSAISLNNTDLLHAEVEEGKTPNIPDDVFDRLISIAINEVKNENLPDQFRKEACVVLLLSQIGMRRSELGALEAGQIDEVKCFDDNEIVKYLNFMTYKTAKYKGGEPTKSFLTDIAIYTYEKLEELTYDRRLKLKTNRMLSKPGSTDIGYNIQLLEIKFVVRNCRELGLLNQNHEGFSIYGRKNIKICKMQKQFWSFLKEDDFISVPNCYSYLSLS